MTTYGCYTSGRSEAGTAVPSPRGVSVRGGSTEEATSPVLFGIGLALLGGNVLNDAGLGVLQQRVFERYGRHVEESVTMMSVLGTVHPNPNRTVAHC
jgi:hypothetical protein